MKYTLLILSLLIIGFRVLNTIKFRYNCTEYIERAADANTVESASKELGVAIKYLEENNITKGYTSVMFDSPKDDVGFWYNNLKSCEKDLIDISNDTTSTMLEKSNVLLRLRETLLDGKGVSVPQGVSRYPNNTIWGVLFVSSTLYCLGFFFFLYIKYGSR